VSNQRRISARARDTSSRSPSVKAEPAVNAREISGAVAPRRGYCGYSSSEGSGSDPSPTRPIPPMPKRRPAARTTREARSTRGES
jgi:hypothetical protein